MYLHCKEEEQFSTNAQIRDPNSKSDVIRDKVVVCFAPTLPCLLHPIKVYKKNCKIRKNYLYLPFLVSESSRIRQTNSRLCICMSSTFRCLVTAKKSFKKYLQKQVL